MKYLPLFLFLLSIASRAQDTTKPVSISDAQVYLLGDVKIALSAVCSDSITDDLYAFCIPGGKLFESSRRFENHIVRWNGSEWQNMGEKLDGTVYSLLMFAGELYVTGDFKHVGEKQVEPVIKWDGQSWNSVGSNIGLVTKGLFVWNNKVVTFGRDVLSKVKLGDVIRSYDGTSWSNIPCDMVNAKGNGISDMTIYHDQLVVSGTSGKSFDHCVWSYDGAKWTNLGLEQILLGADHIEVEGTSDRLYVGGRFGCKKTFGKNISSMVFWDGQIWHSTTDAALYPIMNFKIIDDKIYAVVKQDITDICTINVWDQQTWKEMGFVFALGYPDKNPRLSSVTVFPYKNHVLVFGSFNSLLDGHPGKGGNVSTGGVFLLGKK